MYDAFKRHPGGDLLSHADHRHSTIGAGGLNFSVRNGKRCDTLAIVAKIIDQKSIKINERRKSRAQ